MRIYKAYIVAISTSCNQFFFGSVLLGFCNFFISESKNCNCQLQKNWLQSSFFTGFFWLLQPDFKTLLSCLISFSSANSLIRSFFFKKKQKGEQSSFLDSIILQMLTCFCISFYSAYALIQSFQKSNK